MSDRRAFSAGHAAAARHHAGPSALGETWRVAVGGNRVESMTAADIAHAFQAGHLNVRTPLWPPGASGWQALGNFEQFQMAPPAYDPDYGGQLSHFQESDDDPTRMWTGSADMDLASMAAPMPPAPPPPVPSTPPARPSMRTGPRPVSQAPRPAAPITSVRPARSATAAPTASPSIPPFRRKNNGWLLVAGLVGLVGLGSAVLATRGDWNALAKLKLAPASAEAASAAQPAPAAPAEAMAQATTAEGSKPAEAKPAEGTAAEGAAAPAAGANVNDVAKYEEGSASAFMGGSEAAKAEAKGDSAATDSAPMADIGATGQDKSESSSGTEAETPRSRTSKKALTKSTAAPKRAAMSARAASASNAKRAATPLTSKPEAEPKADDAEAAEAPAAEAAGPNVNQAAATALANSAKLASSCRPRGGPSGSGKARIIYSQDGEVQSVEILTAKFRDTLTGSCVRMVFRRAKIPAFKGEPPTFIKSFTIPEE